MANPLPSLTQSHLQLLQTCPPQFQRRYLEQLGGLVSPDHQAKTLWGKQFHHLVQQWTLGLPVQSLLADQTDPQLQTLHQSLQALLQAVPALHLPPHQRQAEHRRTLRFQDVIFTVVYDLLVQTPTQAQILDWKTYPQPPRSQAIAHHWQTKLYLYVLAETTAYAPEHVSMTYWFVQSPDHIQSQTFPYSLAQHQQIHQELTHLVPRFHQWLQDWNQHQTPLPHRADCDQCPYYRDWQKTLGLATVPSLSS